MLKKILIFLLLIIVAVVLVALLSGRQTSEVQNAGAEAVQDLESELGSLQLQDLQSELQDLDQGINQL